jgi:multidrug efflux system membrane fusion protein
VELSLSRSVFVLSLAAVTVAACSSNRPPGPGRVSVSAGQATVRSMPVEVAATGSVEPLSTVAVVPQVGGILEHVRFAEGSEVRAGQVLFEIDPRPFQAAVQAADANLARDLVQEANARRDAERYRQLAAQASVTESDYQQRQATADALAAAVRADSAALTTARLNLEYATIRAPVSGRTGGLLVHEGNLVRTSGATPLVTINQLRPILVRFAVPAAYLPDVQRRAGDALTVLASPSRSEAPPAKGLLSFVDNHVDSTTGTVLLKARFANQDGTLWPGEFVQVTLVLSVEPDALVVPAQAVVTGQQGTYVFVVKPDSTVDQVYVTVARAVDSLAVISSGLKAGDVVVTDGQLRLTPHARVELRAPPPVANDVAGQ